MNRNPANKAPRFGPSNEPSRGTVAAFERAYVLAEDAGKSDMRVSAGRFLDHWRHLLSPEFAARIFGDLENGWLSLDLSAEEVAAAERWRMSGDYWPVQISTDALRK